MGKLVLLLVASSTLSLASGQLLTQEEIDAELTAMGPDKVESLEEELIQARESYELRKSECSVTFSL